jgi:hypothetical protein
MECRVLRLYFLVEPGGRRSSLAAIGLSSNTTSRLLKN